MVGAGEGRRPSYPVEFLSNGGFGVMPYSSYIGRVGALAVALGVGCAVASPAGVAWADSEESTSTSSTSPETGTNSDAGSPAGAPPSETPASLESPADGAGNDDAPGSTDPQSEDDSRGDASQTAVTVEVAPGVVVSSSGGAQSSTETDDDDAEELEESSDAPPTPKSSDRPDGDKAATAVTTDPDSRVQARTVRVDEKATVAADAPADASNTVVITETRPSPLAATQTQRIATPRPSPIIAVLDTVVTPILSRILGAIPGVPTDSPLGWMLLAAARRQFGASAETTDVAPRLAAQPTLMTALVANLAPIVNAVFGTPIGATGTVTGQLVGTDPEGRSLTYTLTTAPSSGKLVFDSATAKFTYTPTTAQRIAAAVTETATDTIAMTVTVTDGTNTVPTVINIPVSAAPIRNLAQIGAADAGSVITRGTQAFVTNRTAGTVTIIDTTTFDVVRTISVGAEADDMVIKPDGTRLYVTSRANNTLTVVNTSTGAIAKQIAITSPTAIAINSSGSYVYVTSDAGTMTKISTMYNKSMGTVKLPAGSRPTDIAVSPDKTKIYVISSTADGRGSVALIGYTSSTSSKIADMAGTPKGLAVSADNKRLYVSSADGTVSVIDTVAKKVVATHTVGGELAGVAVSKDGSMLLTTDKVGRVAALDAATGSLLTTFATRAETTPMTVTPAMSLSPDGIRLYVTDYDADKVYVVSLIPPNVAPTPGTSTVGAPTPTYGTVTGTVRASDPDGDTLKYTLSGAPANGKVVVNANGTFTYTPTATARHAASAVGAPASALTDSFVVAISDGKNEAVTATITVKILPANKIPVASASVGTPYASTGVVFGSVKSTDGDGDVRTYTATTPPTKGTVKVTSSTGSFVYTPTDAARHAAAKVGATTADKTDTFTVTVDDGHGGVVTKTVTVAVSPANTKPTAPTVVDSSTDRATGVVTGTVRATDANNDALSYTATGAGKGVLTMRPDGTFTYTPTMAARNAAAVPGATSAATTDTVTVTVADGYGGTTTATLTLTIAPFTAGNVTPTNGGATMEDPTTAIGTVTGTVNAEDANGDALTYVLDAGPTKGLVQLDAATGAFTYTPNVDARYAAKATPGVDIDTFTVGISDGNGGWTTTTVQVEIAPAAASSIDQRSTTVAVAAPDTYFYTQAELDKAFDALKEAGITSVRFLIPWAGIEPTDDGWDWAQADRMVAAAEARGIEILAVLNSTPGWAAAPNMPVYAGYPISTEEFAEFAGAVATRYQGKIAAYEVYNEVNAMTFWAPQPNAAQYTALLKAGYTAIKAADPDAVVVAAGLAPLIDFGTFSVNAVRFVAEMYEAGAAGYFDAMAYHPYLYGKMFTGTNPTNPDSPINQVKRIHELMVANGDGNKTIWATEYGQPGAYAGEESQAEYLGDFLRSWRDLDYAGPAYIHTLRDYEHADSNHASFGLFRNDWTPKPVWFEVAEVIQENAARLNVD